MERLQEILALLEAPDQLTDEQLTDLITELADLYRDTRKTDELDDETIEALAKIADAADKARAVQTQKAEAAATAAAEAEADEAARLEKIAELDARMSDEDGDDDEDGEDDGDGGGSDEGDADGEDLDAELEDLLEKEKEKEPVTAGATPADIAKRQHKRRGGGGPAFTRPRTRILVAGAGGGEFSDRVHLEDELLERWNRMEGTGDFNAKIATFASEYPADRVLPQGRVTDMNDYANAVRQAAYVDDPKSKESLQALMADGGLCAPVNVWYDLQTVSQAARNLRGSVTQFNANRGGIKFNAPTVLADILTNGPGNASAAIGVITEAQDAAGSFDKGCQRVQCGEEIERKVDEVYKCLEFGNFIARTNPERTSQFTDLSIAAMARFSEQRLFAKMVADATPIGGVQEFGALRDLLRNLNRIAVNFRARHRMPRNAPIRVDLPAYVLAMCQDDMTASLNSELGMLSVTEAQINAMLATRNVRAVWFEDEFTDAQASGALANPYPSTFKAVITHEGAHVYVDNGELDLGIVRDSTLNSSNLFRTWMAEFWTYAMLGVESLVATFSFCPNGASAGSLPPVCGS